MSSSSKTIYEDDSLVKHKFIMPDFTYSNDKKIVTCPNLVDRITVGKRHIISAWNTNIYITGLSDGDFKIDDQYGEELQLDREYVLISPDY